jgi:hypothetical protein
MWFAFAQVLTLLLAAVGMTMSLAHALELPGKMRLPRETYLAVQPIYYPGFTIGGAVGEIGAMIALVALAFATSGAPQMLTWVALAAFAAAHAVFWLVTQPMNKFWLSEQKLEGASKAFFETGASRKSDVDWRQARTQWEYSHVARSVLHIVGVGCLAAAIALG